MTENSKHVQPVYHRIRAISFKGGFLDGSRLEFDSNLNCLIGGRGSGKTTVIEAIRYALDRMPDSSMARERFQHIEKLVGHNLGGGSLRIEVETVAGVRYIVDRGYNEKPLVTDESGQPAGINIGNSIVFDVDIYSQNQIEETANDSRSQLSIIDKCIEPKEDMAELERQIRDKITALQSGATKILDLRKYIDDSRESIRELPDITAKLQEYQDGEQGPEGSGVGNLHKKHAMCEKERQLVQGISELFDQSRQQLGESLQRMSTRFEEVFDVSLQGAPNQALLLQIRETVETAIKNASNELIAARSSVISLQEQLQERHVLQDKQYREQLEQYEQERAKGVERTRLEKRYAELRDKENDLHSKEKQLARLLDERVLSRAELSELRDKRYQLRREVAERLSSQLAPMIRIRIEQFGNTDDYRSLLAQAMKGSGLRYNKIVERVIERIPPDELAFLIQNNDSETLERELDIDANRATRLVIQLKDKPEIFEIETVDLQDRPIIELKDGSHYKDSASLSTGQKCTTILPLLLLESERPLLIDQPEDNLDNAFVFETVVQSIDAVRGRRQLIFVTHNPNIPVLGEAERIFVLQSTGDTASVVNAGSVDEVASEIITILEGGEAAFEARRKRYGRPEPAVKAH